MTKKNDQADNSQQEQPFVSHLVELRDRLMRVVVAVLVIFLALFPFANDLYQYVSRPLLAQLPQGHEMIATGVISPFLAPFKLSLVVAIFLAMPYILYQFWAFIAPGLYRHEKRVMMPMVGSSALLFYLGALFAYYVVFPLVFAFMVATTPEGVNMTPDISQYLEFVLTLFFAFGLAFEVPIATIILVWMGITTPKSLGEKRPFIIVGAFCVGMLLTPPDVISQTLLALPMWVLFEFGVFFSRFVYRDRLAREAAAEAESENQGSGAEPKAPPSGSGIPAAAMAGADDLGESAKEYIQGFDGDPSPEQGIDEERFVPLTEEELDAELDLIEEEEAEEESETGAAEDQPPHDDDVGEKLKEVQKLRNEGNEAAARKVLYEVLAEGDEDQINVARNILAQLDD
jgi:sec-independent protein translocase protein TatC